MLGGIGVWFTPLQNFTCDWIFHIVLFQLPDVFAKVCVVPVIFASEGQCVVVVSCFKCCCCYTYVSGKFCRGVNHTPMPPNVATFVSERNTSPFASLDAAPLTRETSRMQTSWQIHPRVHMTMSTNSHRLYTFTLSHFRFRYHLYYFYSIFGTTLLM